MKRDDPDERSARLDGRADFRITGVAPRDPGLDAALREWDWVTRSLLANAAVGEATRVRLEDSRRIVGEIARVLAGEEEGEGRTSARLVRVARHGGRIQGVVTLFLCPRAVFVELLAAAPWSLLGPGDPRDSRAVRGAGAALIAHASLMAREEHRGGRVTLLAENARALAAYERMGFARMRPSDAPLALVPEGKAGYSESIKRLAQGKAGPEERRAPWMLLDPERPVAVPRTSVRRPAAAAGARRR